MKRNNSLIILAISTFLLIFSTAATCSMCGFSVSSNSSTSTETSEDNQATKTEMLNQENIQTDKTTDSDSEQDREEVENTNHMPEVTNIIHNGDDITEMLSSEPLIIRIGIDEVHEFNIVSKDEDNDELKFNALASEGTIENLHDIDDNTFGFNYIPPSGIAFSDDIELPIPVNITVSISDSYGSTDTYTIQIGLEPVVAASRMIQLHTDNSNSGYVTQDTEVRTGIVLVGDNNADKQLKGYFSFDLSPFYDLEPFRIRDVSIFFNAINKSGDPADISGILDFKTIEYGNLELSDFTPGGIRIKEVNTNDFISSGSYSLISTELINTVLNAIDENKYFYQIKLGLKSATNSNGAFDIIEMHPENVYMHISE